MDKVVNFLTAVFVFVLIIDPGNELLKVKTLVFGVLFLTCILTYRYVLNFSLLYIFIIYFILALTSVFGIFFSYPVDEPTKIYMYQTFLMMLLLLWINHLKMLEKIIFPGIILSLIVCSIQLAIIFVPGLEYAIYSFVITNAKNTLLMGRRTFLGIEIMSSYYNSVTVLLLPMGVYLYKWLNDNEKKIKNFLIFFILILPLLLGGTRASFLATLVCVAFIILIRLWKTNLGKIFTLILGFGGSILAVYIVFLLFTDYDEPSNMVKQNLLTSIFTLLQNNPLILVFGQGVGATFESVARGSYTALTEWSYLEFVRWFGIPFTCLILFVYLYPLYILYKYRKYLVYALPLAVSYVFYLMIAATNPLLVGSNGILAMLVVYSYAFNDEYRKYGY